MKQAGWLLCTVMLLLSSLPARANSRYPLANQLVVGPSNASHMAIRATFGLVLSSDHGATWNWVCEGAAGFVNGEDPPIELTQENTIFVTSSAGFSVSHDYGCSWSTALKDDQIVDADVDPAEPRRSVAIASLFFDGGFGFNLRESIDNGVSWKALGVPHEGYPLTLAVAPSEPQRIYVSAMSGEQQTPVILRTDDLGQNWHVFPLPADDEPVPFLATIDPTDPNRVYVRAPTASTGDILLVSKDAGNSWERLLKASGPLLGFALAPDAKQLAIGGPSDALKVANTVDYQFHEVNQLKVSCLTWSRDALYACADQALAGFAAGRSTDGGKNFASLLRLSDLTLKQCASATESGKLCPAAWEALLPRLGADAGTSPQDAGTAGSDAGVPDDVDADAPKPDASMPTDTPAPKKSSSGCALNASAYDQVFCVWLVLAALAGLRARRPG